MINFLVSILTDSCEFRLIDLADENKIWSPQELNTNLPESNTIWAPEYLLGKSGVFLSL